MPDEPEPKANAVHKLSYVVTEADTAAALSTENGTRYPPVLATMRIIALLEVAAGELLAPLCKEGQLSAGVDVNVRHLAATLPGATVTATARYTGRVGKLYAFEVIAYDAAGEIMKGEHTRAIVDLKRIIDGAAKRKPKPA